MGARSHAEPFPARRYVEIPAWVALVVAVAALVVGIYALQTGSEDTTTGGGAVAATNPWAGVDEEMLAALEEAGFTGRLGGATFEEPTNPWAGVDDEMLEALEEAGFTGRLGG